MTLADPGTYGSEPGWMTRGVARPYGIFGPARSFWATFEVLLASRSGQGPSALLFLGLLAGYWVYVPIHELLHALGCALTRGTVTALEIKSRYGGALLARVFPFVTSTGEYAGRLTGFNTHGSDLSYASTIACPYLLTFAALPLLRVAARRGSVLAFAFCVPAFWAPVVSVTGDYYELASLLLSRLWPWSGSRDLVSDDLFRLLGERAGRADHAREYPFIAASCALSLILAWGSVALADRVPSWMDRYATA